ncbi:hypothetical protein SIDU_01620 [Sphingobium indicum B90A]|uniref:Uncharacterized protein n=1 Tax=Sphingobium indicum (strain DSM 16412 / CCM 7286 / MTCC 6364 / B90A) TaxID=861109 RepID=A0A1L5BKA2_SPHIB|nr:hypothetical protein SIDU_01620 [Sphingobium indicum B90A]
MAARAYTADLLDNFVELRTATHIFDHFGDDLFLPLANMVMNARHRPLNRISRNIVPVFAQICINLTTRDLRGFSNAIYFPPRQIVSTNMRRENAPSQQDPIPILRWRRCKLVYNNPVVQNFILPALLAEGSRPLKTIIWSAQILGQADWKIRGIERGASGFPRRLKQFLH